MMGIIGGSGFYDFFDEGSYISGHGLLTGAPGRFLCPSEEPYVGAVEGKQVAFIPRHGMGHDLAPAEVPYTANIKALFDVGVTHIIASFASGSLKTDMAPGHFVVPDQIVDRTYGRHSTFQNKGNHVFQDTNMFHLPCASPYDDTVRHLALRALSDEGVEYHNGGTVCVINGPRFSTKAESLWYQAQGWDLINMTQAPEAFVAAEAGIKYASISVVTDYDFGLDVPGAEPVTHEMVMEQFGKSVGSLKNVIRRMVELF